MIPGTCLPVVRAIIVVHLHGLPVNMDEIRSIAKKYNLKVVEDPCQANGAQFKRRKVGLRGGCTEIMILLQIHLFICFR